MSSNNLTLTERLELYKFFTTVAFSGGVAIFCMIQLAWHPGQKRGTNDSFYSGLLGSCVALWFNPGGAKKENNFAVDSQQTTIMANREQGE
jgi:hypothetical protein